MAAQAYSLLKDVNDDVQNWRIKVRVARMWEHRDDKKDNELLRIHLVLVDEKGTGIHASIPQGRIASFQQLLVEGRVYYLHYFEISPVTRPYRSTVHRFELRFAAWTTVNEVEQVDAGFPLHYYTLRSFKELVDSVTDKTYLADVVGLVNGISPLVSLTVRGSPSFKRNLRITDARHTAIVALWGDKARELDADALIDRSSREPVILLAMGCGFRIQDSMLQVSPSYGSKLCFDALTSEISAFRNRIAGLDHSIEVIADKGRRLGFSEIEDVSVSYLVGLIPHDHMNKVYRCKITIVEVPLAQNWWFRSCDQCGSTATEDGDSFRCSKEFCISKSASPRYKLGVKAGADGAVVDMIFFGDTAMELLGKPADVLIVEFLDSNAPMPAEMERLVGRRYVVEVTVSRFSLRRDRIDFQVLKFFPEGGASYAAFAAPGAISQVPVAAASSHDKSTVSEPAAQMVLPHSTPTRDSIEAVGAAGTADVNGSKLASPGEKSGGASDAAAVTVGESTPPQTVLEAADQGTPRGDSVVNSKTTETTKKKRARNTGAKSSAAKRLYTEDQEAEGQSEAQE